MDKTKIAIDVFEHCASDYQDKFMNVDLYKDSLDVFCNNIMLPNAQVLEIACGPGNITKYLLQKRPDLKILGIDLAVNMLKLAKINNPGAEFKVMDCRNIGTTENRYDAIICGFGLPYLSKEESKKLISDAFRILTSKGILYLSTMEDDYSKSGFKKSSTGEFEMYIYYHQADYLISSLEENNFEIIDLQRKIYAGLDNTQTTDLIIIAQNNIIPDL